MLRQNIADPLIPRGRSTARCMASQSQSAPHLLQYSRSTDRTYRLLMARGWTFGNHKNNLLPMGAWKYFFEKRKLDLLTTNNGPFSLLLSTIFAATPDLPTLDILHDDIANTSKGHTTC